MTFRWGIKLYSAFKKSINCFENPLSYSTETILGTSLLPMGVNTCSITAASPADQPRGHLHPTKEVLRPGVWSPEAEQRSSIHVPRLLQLELLFLSLQTKRRTWESEKCVFSWAQWDDAAILDVFFPHTRGHIDPSGNSPNRQSRRSFDVFSSFTYCRHSLPHLCKGPRLI